MSHTTLARFVNLNVASSRNAQVANYLIVFGIAWAVILSDISLGLSSYLLLLIIKLQRQACLVIPSTQGCWHVHRNGTVRSEACSTFLTHVDLSTQGVKVTFRLEAGENVTIWRDSCNDEDYRLLCLILLQWKMGAEAPM